MLSILNDTKGIDIFFSYSHKDSQLRNALDIHLSAMKREGLISSWYDRSITGGSDFREEIDLHLNTAHVILLLVSPDFFASEYAYSVEMKRALERYETNEARVIPILLRPVDLEGSFLVKLQFLPTNGKPVTKWTNRDEAFLDIARGIRRIVRELSIQRLAIEPLSAIGVEVVQSALPLIWNIPHQCNSFFIGRDNLFNSLHDELNANKRNTLVQCYALSGLGGIGKTQFVVEYAYRYRSDYRAILWANASSRTSLISDYKNITDILNISEKNLQDASLTLRAVKQWLEVNDDWLLIFDHVEDIIMFKDFLPSISKGHILLTTRVHAMSRMARRIVLEKLEPQEGALFLLRRANIIAPTDILKDATPDDRVKAEEISQLLDGLPLALDQAAAYIEETSCGLDGYLNRYRIRRIELLKRRGSFDSDHPEPVTTTWSRSFEEIKRTSPVAAELLWLCSFFHPDAIPEELITESISNLGPILQPVATDPFKLDAAIEEILKYSLLHRDLSTQELTIHRLVQAVLIDEMDENTWQERIERAIRIVNDVFPYVTSATREQCQRYLPHAKACAGVIRQRGINFEEKAQLLHKLGCYFLECALYSEAEASLEYALEIWEKICRPEALQIADCYNDMAILYDTQCKYVKAELLYQKAIGIYNKILGPDTLEVAACLNNVAILFHAQSKYVDAASLLQQALHIYENELGIEHPQVAVCLNNLGEIYRVQDKYDQAMSCYQRSLSIWEKTLEIEHLDAAACLNNIGLLYYAQGQYAQAEKVISQALNIRKNILGTEHPDVAACLNNLALLYYSQGEYTQAEPLLEEALNIRKNILGTEHPDVAACLNNLAILSYVQHEYIKAEQPLKQALMIWEKAFGTDHLKLATVLNNLAALYYAQGQYSLAEPMYQRVLNFIERNSMPEHSKTAIFLNNAALLYYIKGAYPQAESLYLHALDIQERDLGAEESEVLNTLNNLAVLYSTQAKFSEAELLYKKITLICEQKLGKEHLFIAHSFNNLATLYYNQGNYLQAELLQQRSRSIWERIMAWNDCHMAISLNNLALLYSSRRKYAKAELLYQNSIDMVAQALGKEHPDIATSLNNFAMLHYLQKEYVEAERILHMAQDIWKKTFGTQHPYMAISLNNFAVIYQSQNQDANTEQLYQQSLAILKLTLPSSHPYFLTLFNNLGFLYEVQGRDAQAESFYASALDICDRSLGENHPYRATVLKNHASILKKIGREEEGRVLALRANSIWNNYVLRSILQEI